MSPQNLAHIINPAMDANTPGPGGDTMAPATHRTRPEPDHAAADHFDLVVIGSGPAGEKGANQAAYHGHRVAVVERRSQPVGA
jgi:NADPH-dependent 2,4-dienoyl-CoA reductase/sulfur reductase-like enzyme